MNDAFVKDASRRAVNRSSEAPHAPRFASSLRRLAVKTSLAVALATALSLGATVAHAEVRVSGFGQIVAGQNSGSNDLFPERNYDDSVDFREESLFAVQIDADLNERVSATAQVLARGSEDFDAELAWAYANIKLTDTLSAKLGRQRLPLYRYSDYLDVGYAYPWIRPPVAMYNQPWSNFDGASLTHATYFGDWYSQAQVLYGNFEGEAQIDNLPRQGKLDHLTGLSWDLEYNEWLSFRAAYFRTQVSVTGSSLDDLVVNLRATGNGLLADRMDYIDDRGTFVNVGVRVDRANWLLVGEMSEAEIEDSILDGTNRRDWYATVGRRFGTIMPHVTHGRRDADVNAAIAGAPLNGPAPVVAQLRPFVAVAAGSQQRDESFTSLGVRWDFAANVAFKADYTKFESDLATTRDADLVSAGVVFTF